MHAFGGGGGGGGGHPCLYTFIVGDVVQMGDDPKQKRDLHCGRGADRIWHG